MPGGTAAFTLWKNCCVSIFKKIAIFNLSFYLANLLCAYLVMCFGVYSHFFSRIYTCF